MPTNPFEPPKEVNEPRRQSSGGFFGKHNRRATHRTVIEAACLGAVGGFTLAAVQLTTKGLPVPGGYLGYSAVLFAMTLFGAVVGAIVEWQVR
jgi:hypothetical protein